MTYEVIEDHTQMEVDDILEHRCPRFGIVTQWRVVGIYLGASHVQGMVKVQPITKAPAEGHDTMMVPEQMTRGMKIVRKALG